MTDTARRLTLLVRCAIAALCVGAIGCGDDSKPRDDETSPVSVSLDQDTAIELVQEFTRARKVSVRVPYYETRQQVVSCSQIDVDTDPYKDDPSRAKCKNRDTRPPHGTKTVPRQVKRYRNESRSVPQASRLKAVQRPSEPGKWFVSVSFESEGEGQEAQWVVGSDRGVEELAE